MIFLLSFFAYETIWDLQRIIAVDMFVTFTYILCVSWLSDRRYGLIKGKINQMMIFEVKKTPSFDPPRQHPLTPSYEEGEKKEEAWLQ